MADDYSEFVRAKARFDKNYGFEIDADEVNPTLLDHHAFRRHV